MGKHTGIFKQLHNYFFGHDAAEHWFFLLIWCSGLVAVVRSVVIRFTGSIALSYVVYYGIFLVSIACTYKRYLSSKIRGEDFVFVFFALLIYFSNYLFFPGNEKILNEWLPSFAIGALPMFFVGLCLDIEKYKKPLFYASIVCLIYFTFYNLYYLQNLAEMTDEDTTHYRMDFAYGLLPYLLFIAWETLSDFKIWKVPVLALAFVLLIMLGTRGPLVFAVLFVVLYTLFFTKGASYVKVIVAITGILIYVNLYDILNILYDETETFGMSTRIMAQMLGYEEMNNSREGVAELFYNYMATGNFNPLLGAGIGAGSVLLDMAYAHNLYVDMIFTLGYVLGNLCFLAVVILIIRAFLKVKSPVVRQYLFIMFILGFASLFLSDTFVKQPWFYMLIGACVGYARRSKIYSRV